VAIYQVDSEDANFLFLEKTESPTHISLLYLYDQSAMGGDFVRFTQIRQHVANRLNSAPVFRQKIRQTPGNLDFPYWEDDKQFDLDFHIRHLGLPKPGDWRQFCIQIARLHSRPLDISRPLWELYVIEGLDNVEGCPPNSFALYLKVHHGAMDEFTAQELMQSLHLHKPDPHQHEHSQQKVAHLVAKAPSTTQMLAFGLVNNTLRSSRLALQLVANWSTLGRIAAGLSLRLMRRAVDGESVSGSPSTRFAAPLSSSRVFDGGFYSRELLEKYAAEVPGATVSHALLAICGETMRTYLQGLNELGAEPLQAMLAVNVRNAGAHALIGNNIAVSQVALHTDLDFPVSRLQAIYATHPELQSIENEELTSFRLRSLYENLPAPLMAWLGRNANSENSVARGVLSAGNCGVSEMSGSDKPLYLMGARLLGFTGIPPLFSGCGLMFSTSSYCDRMGITFVSDSSMIPDSRVMRRCLDDAVHKVEQYLQEKNKSKPARKTNRRSQAVGAD
jgi:WS/DGAT/MGAT family acyltransferase